jgi:hypothetical protein
MKIEVRRHLLFATLVIFLQRNEPRIASHSYSRDPSRNDLLEVVSAVPVVSGVSVVCVVSVVSVVAEPSRTSNSCTRKGNTR